jgi:hypothetical protein
MRFHRNISLLKLCVTMIMASFMCFFLEYLEEFRGSYVHEGPNFFCLALAPENSGAAQAICLCSLSPFAFKIPKLAVNSGGFT